jgi:spectinomycin phosphotransferase
LVARILTEHWGFEVAEVTYAPVGFGSYHWIASADDGPRWFVTADRVGAAGGQVIEASMQTSKELADRGCEFAVAPLADQTGTLVRELLPGWTLVVLPYLQGWSTPDGAWDDPAEREQIVRIIGRLHAAPAPEALQRWDFAIPDRDALLAALADLDHPWSGGPYAEPTQLRLAGADAYVHDRLEYYDTLAREVEASDDPWVITHGEPHSANVLRTPNGEMRLVDWVTVRLAPRERDLKSVLGGPLDVLPAYQSEAGPVSPRRAALELLAGALAGAADGLGCDGGGQWAVHESGQRVDEGFALRGRQGVEGLGVDLVDDSLAFGGDLGAGVGDGDDAGAAVGRGGSAFGVAGFLERVDGDDHRGLVHVRELGDLDLGAFRLEGVPQHALHPQRQADLRQRRGQLGLQDMTGVHEVTGQVGHGTFRKLRHTFERSAKSSVRR